jgi:putative restriction endonuclease
VADWDDESKQFLILFGEELQNLAMGQEQDAAFQLQTAKERRTAQVQVRIGQQKFRFDVLKLYGPKCSVCSIAVPRLLAAAHICGKEHNGSDDWRNGIPLFHSHHAAFDADLFFVDPNTLEIQVGDGLSAQQLAITETTLKPIHARPHRDALQWRIDRKKKSA